MSEPVFIDTSALYAALDATDGNGPQATRIWERLLNDVEVGTIELVTHSSVIVSRSRWCSADSACQRRAFSSTSSFDQ